MLKYFYISKKGTVLKKELFRKLKELTREDGTVELLNDLEDFSAFYKILRCGSKAELKSYFEDKGLVELARVEYRYEAIHSSIEALRLFKITQFYPLLYSAVSSLIRDGLRENSDAAKDLVKLTSLLENYHFINNMVCERVGNEVEKPYAKLAAEFSKEGFSIVFQRAVKFFKETKAKGEEFIPRFEDTWYTAPDTIPQLMYIFDRFSNEGVALENRIRLFNPEQLKKRNHNIEHVYPQNPSSELLKKLPKPENIDNIGNLLGISFRVNSKLQNKSPVEKIELLKGPFARDIQNHVYVQDFVGTYESSADYWDDALIAKRAKSMAKKAYEKVWPV
jgi:hypothetical protein